MLYKVALTRVTTRVASNTPIRMAPFDSLDHYHRTESQLDSLIALDVPSESKYQRHNRHASAPRLASQRRFQQAAVVGLRSDHKTKRYKADTRSQAQNPLIRGTVRWRRSYRSPAGLPLERPGLVPFPSAPSLLDFHLPHAIVWMAENTRPMGADADEIWSSSETTMHNGAGSGNIDAINTESRFRAQVENLLDAHVFVQMARGRSCAGLAAGGNLPAVCYCPSTGKPAAVNISATRQVGLVSADQPVTQSSDQNAPGGHASPANGLALSDQPSRITLQRPLMIEAVQHSHALSLCSSATAMSVPIPRLSLRALIPNLQGKLPVQK
ncbi:hypothetical protein CNYM01_03145 [Colletotrichum nymphaeae SA-01]|uniref:Uncharacterized protein n=1 Tax=Colletotrichum nymphaeae SA-01 TaxID=1460502 RepID=A0A135RXT5_9PEZI|nr:hypothetical protein CNYM01_03145 [Colletotrichum nymphaeae SA-01]